MDAGSASCYNPELECSTDRWAAAGGHFPG